MLAQDIALVVDQFEELFTLCANASDRGRFIDALVARAARPDGFTVLGVRADFHARCIELPGSASLLAGASVPVDPWTEDDVREVTTKPAHQVGVTVERALVTKILAEVAGRVAAGVTRSAGDMATAAW